MSLSTKSFLRLSNATGIRRFGEQLTWIQDPDIFHMRLVGTLEAVDFKKILDWQAEWGNGKRHYFVICDMTQLQSMSRESRKYASEHGRIGPGHEATINFGASFTLRVVAEMSARARKVMGLSDMADIIFVETQPQALAELEKLRQKLDCQSSK